MDKIQKKTCHCTNCGREKPVVDDGYTACCNEPTCCGSGNGFYDTYGCEGKPEKQVKACCWAMADEYFDKKGIKREEGEIWCLIN